MSRHRPDEPGLIQPQPRLKVSIESPRECVGRDSWDGLGREGVEMFNIKTVCNFFFFLGKRGEIKMVYYPRAGETSMNLPCTFLIFFSMNKIMIVALIELSPGAGPCSKSFTFFAPVVMEVL